MYNFIANIYINIFDNRISSVSVDCDATLFY